MKRLLVKLGFRIGDPYYWEPTPMRRVALWAHRFRRRANATCNVCGYRGVRTLRGKWCPACEEGELVRAAGEGVVAEEPEWEYGVKFDWKPEPSYVGSHDNCRYFMDQPNDSLEKHAYPDDTKTLLRRRKAGPWVPVKQEGADQ